MEPAGGEWRRGRGVASLPMQRERDVVEHAGDAVTERHRAGVGC
jgi:hypothetical protein